MIHRIRIMRILPDFSTEQVFVFRVAELDQLKAEELGHRFQTRWMELHPGIPTQMVLDWPTAYELGQEHEMPRVTVLERD